MLEPTRGENVLDIALSSQNELVDSVKIHELLDNSDLNQIQFHIKVKSKVKFKINTGQTSTKVIIKILEKNLAKLDWNNMLRNKTTIECWNIRKIKLRIIIEQFVPLKKNKEN